MRDSTNLDLLRSLAVASVFFAHLSDHFTNYRHHYWAHQFGQLGVIMFFVHTSLVLMRSLDRSPLRGGALVWSFYLRRAFRIYPLAILATVFTIPLIYGSVGWSQLLPNVLLIQNLFYVESMWGVEWSLAIEVQMYLLLPLLFLVLRKQAVMLPVAIWALSIPAGILQMMISPRFNVIAYMPCFVAGIWAWRLQSKWRPRLSGAWWPLAIAALMGVWVLLGDSAVIWNRGIFCFALGMAIPLFSDLSSPWIVVPSKQIAKYSYGIYLAHPVAMVVALHFTGPLRWLTLTVLAVLLPVIAYHLIEDPMIRLGKRLARVYWDSPRVADRPSTSTPAELVGSFGRSA